MKIEKLNVLGNEIVVENPSAVVYWLWGMFVYFGLMYFYYFKIVEKSSEFEYRDSIYKRTLFDTLVNKRFIDCQDDIHVDYFNSEHGSDYAFEDSEVSNCGKKFMLTFHRTGVLDKGVYGYGIFPSDLAVNISFMVLVKAWLVANVKASFHTKYFLESYFPYAMCIGVVMFKLIAFSLYR